MTLADEIIRRSLHAPRPPAWVPPAPEAPKPRPTDKELYSLLMLAHGWITQHTVLDGPTPEGRTARPRTAREIERSAVLLKLQRAWEGLPVS